MDKRDYKGMNANSRLMHRPINSVTTFCLLWLHFVSCWAGKIGDMDKESIIELQKIDCNCNDCKHLQRDVDKYKSFDHLYIENGKVTNPSHRPLYGNCLKLNKPVSFLANTCQIETQECFEHRRG